MSQIAKSAFLPFCLGLLVAAEPSWISKDSSQWNEQEAKLLLTDSPWVKKTVPALFPPQSEARRREGGKMGGVQGVGIESLSAASLTGVGPAPQELGKRRLTPTQLNALEVRWESALPVRAAERGAHDTDAPDWEGSLYVLAVYDVPALDINDKTLAGDLKRSAILKPDGMKALRPERVDLLPQVGGFTTVVFLFPRSKEITMENKRIEFTARFGRLSLAQYFNTKEMQFRGKLEL